MSDMRRVGRWGAEPGSIEDTELRIPAGIGHLDTHHQTHRAKCHGKLLAMVIGCQILILMYYKCTQNLTTHLQEKFELLSAM